MAFETKATIANFGGKLLKLQHQSSSTGTPMDVNLFLPPAALASPASKVPVLIYLSGLTCTPQNCTEKGFFQAHAARKGIAVVWPDTSPRSADPFPGEADSWDFGAGAGFYVDATRAPWSARYRMETYITSELPAALFAAFPDALDPARVSLTGHSMGGHGALTLFLKHPGKYRSVSAFAPIANPSRCPWGEKAFTGYLGAEDREEWKKHDATELVRGWAGKDIKALVDVGTGDNFYTQGQLLPENFEKAVQEAGVKGLELRYQPEYDHSYFFMSTFAGDHVEHAAKYLFA
ncbi:putative esterase [Daldinia caldariorum]|uniref:putative esterase n=1 Tax=Daldinia caldariorum TaxID=326644 RepID=UPI0020077AB2|nr:putative esterase [Daldinia caldariorum]KAI1467266.1 putative esterase [Daldinia caldariorum]